MGIHIVIAAVTLLGGAVALYIQARRQAAGTIPFGSLWGMRCAASLQSERHWKAAQPVAAPYSRVMAVACALGGVAALVTGALVNDDVAIAILVISAAIAFLAIGVAQLVRVNRELRDL